MPGSARRSTMETYESFDGWLESQSVSHRRMASQLRQLVSVAAPKLVETSKWGNGCWLKGKLPLLYLHAEVDHLQFGFFAGALLRDRERLLRGKGKYVRHIRVETPADVDEAVFATMIRRAVRAPAYK